MEEMDQSGHKSDSDDTMRILIATDNHLGYMETNRMREHDSFNTFEEILQLAQEYNADFILLGGNLFHDNKPSRQTKVRATKLLRKYCMGDKAVSFEFLSDQSINFNHTDDEFRHVNYEDPNLNVSMPVFSIHGSRDDPVGPGNYCPLEELSAAGLVNYFGKYPSSETIEISPLILKKGSTKLALYGLGAIRDEKLHRMFLGNDVKMVPPPEDNCFNLLVLHQNRWKPGVTHYIPEECLPGFLNMVIWGHENECLIQPVYKDFQDKFVSQPGSSIATTLLKGDTTKKHVGLLNIFNSNHHMDDLKLKTVRQFYMEDIVLSKIPSLRDDPDVEKTKNYCAKRVKELITEAARERTVHQPKKPLIRLRVDLSDGFERFDRYQFGKQFVEHVANPEDLVQFNKWKRDGVKEESCELDLNTGSGLDLDSHRVEDMVKTIFSQATQDKQLSLLMEGEMGEAVKKFVDKDVKTAISELVNEQIVKTQNHLKENLKIHETSDDVIEKEVKCYREQNLKAEEKAETKEEVQESSSDSRKRASTHQNGSVHDVQIASTSAKRFKESQ